MMGRRKHAPISMVNIIAGKEYKIQLNLESKELIKRGLNLMRLIDMMEEIFELKYMNGRNRRKTNSSEWNIAFGYGTP